MKKIIILVFILVAVTLSAMTTTGKSKTNKSAAKTTSITGSVVDEITGETLAGVSVFLEGVDLSVYTGFDGNFEFTDLIPREYTIKTSLISYNECTSKVHAELKKKNKVDIRLKSVAN
ncbi:MAG: carboxypeptidase-like regulatory domain-containing protein [Bacteroidales bacterium]|nr:carboxypeptidase-like regulatory domain-containing protein [Bacteroidales bacterium]